MQASCIASLINSAMPLSLFPAGNSLLKFNFNGMPVANGSFGWRWLVKFSAESASVGEKRLWLTGLNV